MPRYTEKQLLSVYRALCIEIGRVFWYQYAGISAPYAQAVPQILH